MSREIQVLAHWNVAEPRIVGTLRSVITRGKEVFSFEYAESWLAHRAAVILDPELQNYSGPQFLSDASKPNFGLFLDSSPDRWGRTLMRRREAMVARQESRTPRTLLESDYLLGVHDPQRMGGLRFRLYEHGPFLNDEEKLSAPPWAALRQLEAATWKLQNDDDTAPTIDPWLRLLMAPGSSLGGARPKAGVEDEKRQLWIAKFPGRSDTVDVAGWEMLAHELGRRCGLTLPEARLKKLTRRHRTFLVKRFDRCPGPTGVARCHFASAMTLLGRIDGAGAESGDSYLDLAEFILRNSPNAQADLAELWRRILFSTLVRNTDDHLRNHGFLLNEQGWRLSPAYDINPNPEGLGLSLNISEDDNSLSLDLVREAAPFFRVRDVEAKLQITALSQVVRTWQVVAKELGLPRGEQDRMAPAFVLAERGSL